jgi:regulator of RNase E activity RraA
VALGFSETRVESRRALEDAAVIETQDIVRPAAELVSGLAAVGSATASSELSKLGVRSAHIRGPVSFSPGVCVAGPALTLQFMPKREDLYPVDEYAEPEKQLHRHALYHTQPGDIVVVDARGDMGSGVFGVMMMTYFKGRGGVGVVVDGCLRDIGKVKELDLGLWIRGATPNFHTQTDIVPTAVNVPIACGATIVEPGDIIVADDDGAVVVPIKLAPTLLGKAQEHAEWEEFSRERLAAGGDMRRYYPLSEAARPEYEAWKASRNGA